jgi:hypothetical protein
MSVTPVDICDWEETEAVMRRGTSSGEPFDAVVYSVTANYRCSNKTDYHWRRLYHEQCLEVNARGAYHVYQAAWDANIPKVVHVGSITAVLGQPRYEYLDINAVDRPTDLYAATKIFAEHVGRSYAYRPYWHKTDPSGTEVPMQVVCLRLGQPFESEEQWRNNEYKQCRFAICMDDIAQAIERALLADIQYGVYPVVSDNEKPWVHPSLYAELGYKPGWKFCLSKDCWVKVADDEKQEEYSAPLESTGRVLSEDSSKLQRDDS